MTLKGSDEVYAMKRLRKEDMLQKNQVAHVRAERDVLAHGSRDPWVVSLYYTFQDRDFLYMIMEYLPGGDLMTQLMTKEVFTEDETRFYIAESLLALEPVHSLGYIHRY